MRILKSAHLNYLVTATLLACGQCVLAKSPKGLSVSSSGPISNTKKINVKGPLNMESKDSIKNGTVSAPATIKSSSSVTLKAPGIYNAGTIQAGSGINIKTNNLVNTGSISAPLGDLNITSNGDKPLQLDNTKGSLSGKSVSISSENGSVTITGGTISAKDPGKHK